MQGQVLEVYVKIPSSELAADTNAPVTTIAVLSVKPFLEEGGTLLLNGTEYTYTAIDSDANTITLSSAIVDDYDEGDQVYPLPIIEEKWAKVEIQDRAETIDARLSHTMQDRMVEEIRDPADQEVAVVEMVDGDWTIVDLIEENVVIDGAYLDPDTVPIPATSDGAAPGSSPTPTVQSGIGSFFVRWAPPANADAMTFEVHVSDTTGFTPDSTTLYTETPAYTATLRYLPIIDAGTGEYTLFLYSQPYYFKIIAKDADGAAPASAEASASLVQISGPDIAAESIIGDHIFGATIDGSKLSGEIILGSTISTGAIDDSTGEIVGARGEMGPAGIAAYDAANNTLFRVPLDGNGNPFVKGQFEMESAEVNDNFTMRGVHNQIADSGALYLAAGIEAPNTPPTASFLYETVDLDTTTAVEASSAWNMGSFKFNPSQARSLSWNSVDSCWETVQQKNAGSRVWRFNADGSIKTSFGNPWIDDYPDRYDCSTAYCTKSGSEGTGVLFRLGDSFWLVRNLYFSQIPDSWVLDFDRPPVIAYDSSADKWILIQSNGGGSGTFNYRRFTEAAANFGTAVNSGGANDGESGSGRNKRLTGAYYGNGDFGSARFVHTVEDQGWVYVLDSSGNLRDNDGSYEMWAYPGVSNLGVAYNGSQFATISASGSLVLYSNWTWTAADTTIWLGLSAYDSDPSGTSGRYNLFSNPSFESGITGWTGSGATIAQDTLYPVSGTKSLKITSTGTLASARTGTGTTGTPVDPNANYTFSGYITPAASNASDSARVSMLYYDSTGTQIGSEVFSGTTGVGTAGVTTRLSITTTAPSNAAYVLCRIQALTASTRIFYADAMLLEKSSSLGDYIDSTGGTHETPVGGLTSISLRRRSSLRVVIPTTLDGGGADDPDKWRLYFSRQAAEPTLAEHMKLATTAGSDSGPTNYDMVADPTGLAPPGGIAGQPSAVNSFPGGTPGAVYSVATDDVDNLIHLRGDGSGRVGPSMWNTDGKSPYIAMETVDSSNASTGTWTTRVGWTDMDSTGWDGVGVTYSSGQFTVSEAGLYLITGSVGISYASNARRVLRVYKNGTANIQSIEVVPNGTVGQKVSLPFHVIAPLAAGDYFTIDVWQNTGGDLAFSSGAGDSTIGVWRLSV